MDDWSEAVRAARTDDLEQPDRALLLRMLDDAMALADSERSNAAMRRQADALNSAVAEYRATQDVGKRLQALPERLQALSERIVLLKAAKVASAVPADGLASIMDQLSQLRVEVANSHKNQWSADLLSSKIDDYIEKKQKERKNSKYVSGFGSRFRNFIETIGDKSLRDYTRQDFEKYRDILDRTPKRSFDRFKTHNLAVAADKNEKRARPFEVLDNVTVDDGYLTPVKTMFTHFVRNGWIPINFATNVVSARTVESHGIFRADEAKSPFTSDQMNVYFRYIVKKRSRATPDFWLPVLALYTGARLNELSQIEPRRVIMHNDRWHIDLLTIYDENEIAQALKTKKISEKTAALLKLKSASARRLIPIHDDLIRIGFIDFVDERRDRRKVIRLFPRLGADKYGYFSSAVGKRLNLDIGRAGVKTDDVSFYSFRHNFSAALTRALVPERTKDRIMGHVVGGAQGHYGNAALEDVESAVIERVNFPGVDITPYLPRKRA